MPESVAPAAVPPRASESAEETAIPILEWVEKASTELELACELFPPLPSLAEDGLPEWARRLQFELLRTYFPGAFRGLGKGLTPSRFGYALGRQLSLLNWYAEYGTRLARNAQKPPTLSPEAIAKVEEWSRRVIHDWCPAYSRAVRRALVRALDAEFEDSSAFFLRFGEGMRSGLGGGNEFPKSATSPATDIHQLLLFFWPVVTQFGSVRQLHQFLVGLIGSNRVGTQKRIEKICQRIGLTLRPAGRPASAGNTDKPTP